MSKSSPSFPASGAPVSRVAALLSGVRLAWLGLAAVFLWAAAAYLGVEKLTHARSFRLIEKSGMRYWRLPRASVRGQAAFWPLCAASPRYWPGIPISSGRWRPTVPTRGVRFTPRGLSPRTGDPRLSALVRRLDGILTDLDVDQIWVVNAAGDCVASVGFSAEASATGTNYADREYFRLARRDGGGSQFAVGRTSKASGIFHSAAVWQNGVFIGAVVIKIDIARLTELINEKMAFMTDEHGVIILSSDERFCI